MPAYDECRDDGLIPTGRSAEEIDNRDLLLHRIQEPAVIRRVRVGAHECIVDDIISRVDLAMSLALIVVPDPSASSREHRLDAQEVCHLPGLENRALRVISGMRSPPNWNPPARSAESSTSARKAASRSK